jgi:hypothetical protein
MLRIRYNPFVSTGKYLDKENHKIDNYNKKMGSKLNTNN